MSNNVVIVNSIDRNPMDTTFNYRFNFGHNNENSTGKLFTSIKNVNQFFIEYIVMPNIFIDVEDIHAIKKLGMLPDENGDLNRSNFSFPKLSDLKYIIVNIEELDGSVTGSRSINKKASSMFIVSSVIQRSSTASLKKNFYNDNGDIRVTKRTGYNNIGETLMDENHTYIVLKNVSCERTNFTKELLNSLTIDFYKPTGERIELMNDKLTIKCVSSTNIRPRIDVKRNELGVETTGLDGTITEFGTNSPNLREGLFVGTLAITSSQNTFIKSKFGIGVWDDTYYRCNFNRPLTTSIIDPTYIGTSFESRVIEITCNEYFSSEEYKIGDTIVFKNLTFNVRPPNSSGLDSYISREKGHTIVGLRSESTTSTYYNIIEILPETRMDKSSGIEHVEYFDLQTLYLTPALTDLAPVAGDINTSNVEAMNIPYTVSGTILNRDLQNFVSINIKN